MQKMRLAKGVTLARIAWREMCQLTPYDWHIAEPGFRKVQWGARETELLRRPKECRAPAYGYVKDEMFYRTSYLQGWAHDMRAQMYQKICCLSHGNWLLSRVRSLTAYYEIVLTKTIPDCCKFYK